MKKKVYLIEKLTGNRPQFVQTVSKRRKVYRVIERLRAVDPKSVFISSPVFINRKGAAFENGKTLTMTAGAR